MKLMKKKIFALAVAAMAVLGAQAQNTYLGHEYVDLGLPSGTLWAKENLSGLYKWGETEPYTPGTYKFGTDPYTRYNTNDGLTELLDEDNAALVQWGGAWDMPTGAQVRELLSSDNTTINYDSNKITVTSKKNGNSISFNWSGSDDAPILFSKTRVDWLFCYEEHFSNVVAPIIYQPYQTNPVSRQNNYSVIRPVVKLYNYTISDVPEGWTVNGITPTDGKVTVTGGEKVTVVPANIPEGKRVKSIRFEPVE